MKKITSCILLSTVLFSCANKEHSSSSGKDSLTTQSAAQEAKETKVNEPSGTFDISSIPVTDKKPGTFPYLNPPETYTYNYEKEIQQKNINDFDKEYFAVNGKLILLEGKTYKVRIEKDRSNGKRFNSLIVEKSYKDAILALGGVPVNDVPVSQEEIKRVGDKELIEKHYGFSIDYNLLDDIKTYVIRTADKEIWIQMTLMNNESGKLTILEKGDLKSLNVSSINADQIKKDIDRSGKAVLHINFDTDKATLKPDGNEVVTEIAKVLSADKALKIAINGYTDNVGNEAHNLQLSSDRAASVLTAIVAKGIDKSRLSSNGFGAKNPIADNKTEEGKTQNRRVELVKK